MGIRARRDFAVSVVAIGMLLTACSGGPGAPTTLAPSLAPASAGGPSSIASSPPTPAPSRALAEGQIAFVAVEAGTGRGQIYVERADGTGPTAMAPSQFDDIGPAFSVDGRKLVFARTTADGLTALGVYVVDIDGTGLRKIDANGEDPSWAPDGRRLVETRALFDPGAESPFNVGLWIVDVRSGAARQITRKGVRCPNSCSGGGQDGEARWSPDGKRLAFLRETYTSPEQFSIFTMAPDGSDAQRVTPVGMDVGDPHWSPDGTLIAFQSPPDPSERASQNIYTIRSDGTGLIQLTANLQGAFHPAWSPDGRLIVFARFPGFGPNGATLFVMNADGSDLHLLAPTNVDQNAPEWGPLPTSR